VAAVPLKETAEAHKKLVPVIVTVEPIGPLAGEKEVKVGAAGGLYTNESPIFALELLTVLIKYSVFDSALMLIDLAFCIIVFLPKAKFSQASVDQAFDVYFNAV
jgi:hypothetical protein